MRGLQREIADLESRLESERTRDELARIRQDLDDTAERAPTIELPNLRLGFACKQRWEDMVGDDRVRACHGCDRPVFNLSAMTRAAAERLLAARGLTPCVRFYRRPDGTVMTTDCPTGERRPRHRLAVVTSSLAAGVALAAPSASAAPEPDPATPEPVTIDQDLAVTGIPIPDHSDDYEVGIILIDPQPRPRPAIEWSLWGRLGLGFSRQQPATVARRSMPEADAASSVWEAALAAELTLGVARGGDLRIGVWGELRTSSGPVVGAELVVQGLPPHPMSSRIGGAGTIVLRAGGNAHVFTTALGFGYVGARPRRWIRQINHVVGARLVASVNRSLDDPREWSAIFGVEVEPIGALQAVFDLVTDR
jgi:hypothetical protein